MEPYRNLAQVQSDAPLTSQEVLDRAKKAKEQKEKRIQEKRLAREQKIKDKVKSFDMENYWLEYFEPTIIDDLVHRELNHATVKHYPYADNFGQHNGELTEKLNDKLFVYAKSLGWHLNIIQTAELRRPWNAQVEVVEVKPLQDMLPPKTKGPVTLVTEPTAGRTAEGIAYMAIMLSVIGIACWIASVF